MPSNVRHSFAQLGSLNFASAQFSDGEEGGFFFAQDEAGAKAIVGKLQRFAKSGLASPGQVARKGNMVLLLPPHPTAGVATAISTCEASARVT